MKDKVCECDSGYYSGNGHKIIAVLVVVLLAGIFAMVAFNAGAVSGDSLNQKVLSVSGTVEKMVVPDRAEVVLAVETLDLSAQISQSKNASITSAVMNALGTNSDIDVAGAKIETLGYSVQEEFQWNKVTEKSESIGYRTTNQIKVTLYNTSAAGKVIDLAVRAGANRVSGITFGLSKEKELEVRTTALKEASQVAYAKATSIASGLDVSLGKVRAVSESGFYYTPNYQNVEMLKAADAIAPTPISVGEVVVNASVTVAYEIN